MDGLNAWRTTNKTTRQRTAEPGERKMYQPIKNCIYIFPGISLAHEISIFLIFFLDFGRVCQTFNGGQELNIGFYRL